MSNSIESSSRRLPNATTDKMTLVAMIAIVAGADNRSMAPASPVL